MSISFSPYLFGHKPKDEGHLSKTAASKKLVTEDPEEYPAEEYVEESIQETPVVPEAAPVVPADKPVTETAPVNSPTPTTAPAAPATSKPVPIVETDDEILE